VCVCMYVCIYVCVHVCVCAECGLLPSCFDGGLMFCVCVNVLRYVCMCACVYVLIVG
jgi:hypothetical protein